MFSKLKTRIKSFVLKHHESKMSMYIFISRWNGYVIPARCVNAWLWCRWSEAEVECGHGAVPGSRGRDRGGRHGAWGARAQSRPNTRPGHCPPALAPGAHWVDIKYHETGLKGLYPKMWFNKFISHGNFNFCKNYGFFQRGNQGGC